MTLDAEFRCIRLNADSTDADNSVDAGAAIAQLSQVAFKGTRIGLARQN
jgi:hypothetical protein